MSTAAGSNDVECVLISDEDEDDAVSTKVLTNNVKTNFTPSNDIRNVHEQFERSSNDDSEGRRISRRRRNRVENDGNGKFDASTTHDGPKVNTNAQFATRIANDDKKTTITENRAETRSRKRERSPSPAVPEVKDVEPIPYKEILPGLEGAAFQSRYVYKTECWSHFFYFEFELKSNLPFLDCHSIR